MSNTLYEVFIMFRTLGSDGETRQHAYSDILTASDAGAALQLALSTMLDELPKNEPTPQKIVDITNASAKPTMDEKLKAEFKQLGNRDKK